MTRHPAALGLPDANQNAIVSRYEAHLCLTFDAHKMGGGFPDLVVAIPTQRGRVLQLVEVKTEDGALGPAQLRFARDFGPGLVVVVRNVLEVDAHVEVIQRRFKGN